MSEQHKQLVRDFIEEVCNQGNFAAVDELVVGDYLVHRSRADASGPEGEKQYFAMLRAAFPDIHFVIEDQIAEGDKIVTRWTARATHTGEFQGIPATGKPGVVMGIIIDRIANGKFVESWGIFDELGMLQQLGVIPAPQPAGG